MLRQEYQNAQQERTTDVVQVRNPIRTYSGTGGGKLVNAINRRGNPLDKLANRAFSPNALLGQTGGRGGNPLYVAPDELVMEGQPLYNNQQVINRTIEPLGPGVDSIGPFELALLHRKDAQALDWVRVREKGRELEKPLFIVNPATFNYQCCQDQYAMHHSDSDQEKLRYAQMTPQELWSEHWSLDGVIEVAAGYETQGQGSTEAVLGVRKVSQVVSKGPQFIYNYWENSVGKLEPGCRLYAIIKKYDKPARYIVNSRFNNKVVPGSAIKEAPGMFVDHGAKSPFRPFQMGFYIVPPHESRPPREALTYLDEWNYEHYDGLAIYIGTVMSVPRQQPLLLAAHHEARPGRDQPYTDSNVGIDSRNVTMLKIVLDSDDGVMPI